ncbi:hypothetical protein [Nitratifractor salsuginis]|uniref:Formylmethanofuran dehydrogenase subunit E domain-containing protein n=1 Tax=Nitratifractor salsuginis (strain DSM 16511 / JCM 12458 / E9I37-1) TaxID=749222 RepID=E6WYN5_NITSE|nr:hypothetical protein [Nitratifractor salsuginis]ADV45406.1 hypothetical protein Nitsa_0133 [Nitratifractor salsuginis DSM 16511]
MNYPAFFDRAPAFRLYDPLGDFLGAFEEGIVEILYLDCVKLAGHSCPTVAGAFLMTYRGIEALYGTEALPTRSEIRIELREAKSEGVTGVIGNVAAFICGAGDEGGFTGIGGRFNRQGLLHYGVGDVAGDLRLTRLDTGASVTLQLDTSVVGGSPEMMPLMQKSLKGEALPEEQQKFKELWQARVEAMLTTPELWDKIARITETR